MGKTIEDEIQEVVEQASESQKDSGTDIDVWITSKVAGWHRSKLRELGEAIKGMERKTEWRTSHGGTGEIWAVQAHDIDAAVRKACGEETSN